MVGAVAPESAPRRGLHGSCRSNYFVHDLSFVIRLSAECSCILVLIHRRGKAQAACFDLALQYGCQRATQSKLWGWTMISLILAVVQILAEVTRKHFGEAAIWVFLGMCGIGFLSVALVLAYQAPRYRSRKDALVDAVRRGQFDVAQGLLDAGFDVNTPDMTFGMTALSYAREKRDTRMEELLLRFGAKEDIK